MRIAFFAFALTVSSAACAQPATTAGDRILGEWRGTSVCTDREHAPACRDEIIHYVFTPRQSAYHQAAYKLVNGVEELMGEADFTYANARWTYGFNTRTCAHCTWWYSIDDAGALTGGITSAEGHALRHASATRAVS